MLLQRRLYLGAFVLALFVTASLGWLFRGAGMPFAWWIYVIVFVLAAGLIYALGRLMRANGQRAGRFRAFDSIDELE